MSGSTRVLLVDDSALVRSMTARGLQGEADISVVGQAANGEEALTQALVLRPDVVVLDVEMPVLGGLETLPKLLSGPVKPAVIMASSLTRRHAGLSLQALERGAFDYVPKPDVDEGPNGPQRFFEELKAKIRASTRQLGAVAAPPRVRRAAPPHRKISAVAIGASTGGPPALLKVFAQAKGQIRVPVFVTQHMPAAFTESFAQQLGRQAGAPAGEPANGERVAPGHIYVAPGGFHMVARRDGANVTLHRLEDPPEHFCRPSVNPMLRSLAPIYGNGLFVAILTGMGGDGAEGCMDVVGAGGRFVVQDEASSVVWGMPGAAFRTGKAEGAYPLDELTEYLCAAMRGGA